MIWIIGGTCETRELVKRLNGRKNYIITAATEDGKQFIDSQNLLIGRMDYHEMVKFIQENQIKLVIDLSHPYAVLVSKNAQRAASSQNVKYIRYVRPQAVFTDCVIYKKSLDECIEYLKSVSGTVFFTTGSKNIGRFEKIKGNNRFVYRILPSIPGIEECKKYNVLIKDVVAMLGPFSVELNRAMFKEYDADYVIMKDSGIEGGTNEKIKACINLGIVPVVIGREKEEGIEDLDEIVELIFEKG